MSNHKLNIVPYYRLDSVIWDNLRTTASGTIYIPTAGHFSCEFVEELFNHTKRLLDYRREHGIQECEWFDGPEDENRR